MSENKNPQTLAPTTTAPATAIPIPIPNPKKKKYSEWSAEEKAAYKAKRDAYWVKREEDLKSNFNALQLALEGMKAGPTIMDLFHKVKKGSGVEKSTTSPGNRETYLTAIFGTETPTVGQKMTYLQIGVRGPAGERMLKDETMAKFVTRTGDAVYKYDANTISSMVWYIRKRGHEVDNDRNAATVTYLKAPVIREDGTTVGVEAETKVDKK